MIWTHETSAWRRQRSRLGIRVTPYDRRTNVARDSYSHVQKVFGDKVFKTVIGKNVRLEESPAYKEPSSASLRIRAARVNTKSSCGRYCAVSPKRTGLPVALKMRHDAHYVDELISRTGAAIGRMIRAKGSGVSLSVGPVYLNLVPGSNWGVAAGPTLVVTLDPQVNARSPNLENAVDMTPAATDSEQRDVIAKLGSGSLSFEQFSAWLEQRCVRRSRPN